MLRSTRLGSLAARVVKPFVAMALMIIALVAAPAVASAATAPAGAAAGTQVVQAAATPNLTPPRFNCSYFAFVPVQSLAITCNVQVGVMHVYTFCSNGTRVNGPVMRGGGVYGFNLTCSGNSTVGQILWEALA